jgi:hypothetical protein
MEQEPGASGAQLLTHFQKNVLPFHEVNGSRSTSSKAVRAMPFIAACESGKVKMLKRDWNDTFLSEFEDFPNGQNDDQIDCVSIGYNEMLGNKQLSAVWGSNILGINRQMTKEQKAEYREQGGAVWGRKKNASMSRRRSRDGMIL